MKKILVFCLVTIFLASCGGGQSSLPTIPTPTIQYNLISTQAKALYVVVDKSSNQDRSGLQSVADYLCHNKTFCQIFFWDDINKAASGYPMSDSQDNAIIAVYIYNESTGYEQLLVYTLGD